MAVPKVKVPGSSLNPGPKGSSMRPPSVGSGNLEDFPRVKPGGPASSLRPAPAPPKRPGNSITPGPIVRGKPVGGGNTQSRKEVTNNKDAALRRLMQKYRGR